jgi:hypothetical protein
VIAERPSATPFPCETVNCSFQRWGDADYDFQKTCEDIILKNKQFVTPSQIFVIAQIMMAMPRTTNMMDPLGKVMSEYFEGLVKLFAKAGKRCHSPYTDFYKISNKELKIILGILKDEDEEVQKLLDQADKKR